MKSLSLLLILLLTGLTCLCQHDSSKIQYGHTRIDIINGHYMYQNHRMSGVKLGPILSREGVSAKDYRVHNTLSISGGFLAIVAIGAGIWGLAIRKPEDGFWTPQNITMISSASIGIPFIILSKKYLRKSVKKYNAAIP